MLFERFEDIIQKADFIEPFIRFLKLEFGNNFIQLYFMIVDEEDYDKQLMVSMKADKYRDFRFVEPESNQYSLLADHPLMWQYTDTTAELYFSSPASDVEKVNFELFQLHHSLFGDYLPFESVSQLLKTGYGLLLKGPKSFLNECSACLNRNGVKNSIVEYPLSEKKSIEPLIFLVGDNYFIADNFNFQIENEKAL
jgi:hypothetical protein